MGTKGIIFKAAITEAAKRAGVGIMEIKGPAYRNAEKIRQGRGAFLYAIKMLGYKHGEGCAYLNVNQGNATYIRSDFEEQNSEVDKKAFIDSVERQVKRLLNSKP